MKKFAIILLFLMTQLSQARLLDKIVTIVDDEIFTLSQLNRIKETLKARRTILPIVYSSNNYSDQEIADLVVRKFLIRKHLNETGYIISDDQVESKIKETEQNNKINRDQLLSYLQAEGISFEEYFEMMREIIEINIFNLRVIQPLVSITEGEIKNAFYQKYAKKMSLSLKYDLVGFSIDSSEINSKQVKNMKDVLMNYRNTGNLPQEFKNISTQVIGEVTEEGLIPQITNALTDLQEGEFTEPLLIGTSYYVYFVKNKDLIESDAYNELKPTLQMEIYSRKANEISKVWFEKQRAKHFVKTFIN